MAKPPPLGSINCFVDSNAWLGEKIFNFDGTTKGLVKSAIANGAKAGDKVLANYGGQSKECARGYRIVSAPHDNRAGGFWVEDYWTGKTMDNVKGKGGE